MRREDLRELHYITPIGNVPSILSRGILSHRLAAKVRHESVAMQNIQDRRAKVRLPTGRPLHDFANLYICARNPMLYLRRAHHDSLCVLQVSPDVLDVEKVVVADRNASSDYCRFDAAPSGLAGIDEQSVFAEYWTDPNPIQAHINKSVKCAEVLVPDRVPTHLVRGAYVSGDVAKQRLAALAPNFTITVDAHLFFL